MDPTKLYNGKADKYQKSRWGYSPEAIAVISARVGMGEFTAVADIGAGTGILGKHFIGRTGIVYLVEPNQDMRRFLTKKYGNFPRCEVIAGRAEATRLPDKSVDLIAIGQAIHWFDPLPTLREFKRILRTAGWLAVLRNYITNEELTKAIAELFHEISQTMTLKIKKPEAKPLSYYFGGKEYETLNFNYHIVETKERFITSMASAADAPNESNPIYLRFEQLAGDVFEHFSQEGMLTLDVSTELCLGRLA